jgi:type III restriction enzyme
VEGYTQAVRGRVRVDWERIAPLRLTPDKIPPEVEMKAGLPSNVGRPSLLGPGRLNTIDLNPFRKGHRPQELVFELARDLTRDYLAQPACTVPAHVLFPQIAAIVQRYLSHKVVPVAPAQPLDAFLSPYYGWMIERLVQEIRPVDASGEGYELARYESNRKPGSTLDVDFRTRREPYPVVKSHVNAVVPDTEVWEQSAAYRIDRHPGVRAFVKNAGLGFSVPYLHNGQPHDYLADFIIQLETVGESYLILETKGYDPLKEIKAQAAWRWVRAVNREGSFGQWSYEVVEDLGRLDRVISDSVEAANASAPAPPAFTA